MTRWFKSAMAREAAAVKLQTLYRAFAARKRRRPYRSWHEAAPKLQAVFTARQVSAEPDVQLVDAFMPTDWMAEIDMGVSVYDDMLLETAW